MKMLSASPGLVAMAAGAILAVTAFEGASQEKPGKIAGSGVLWRSHFAGRAALSQGTNATRLKILDQLPATTALRLQIATNFARAPREFWQKDLPAGIPNAAELWRPIFEDLQVAESILEVRGPIGRTDAALAIQLSEDRARLWSTNLWKLAGVWNLGTPAGMPVDGVAGATGWQAKRAQAPNLLQFARAGQWVVVGLGQDKLTSAPGLLQHIGRSGRPPAADGKLLEVRADVPALSTWFPILAPYHVPPLHLTVRGLGDYVRTEIQFQFPGPVPWRSEPWLIPTNLVGEPLTSFTAARGVASLLGAIPGIGKLGLQTWPNQLTAWGVSNEQCRVYMAAPVPNASAAVSRLAVGMPLFLQSHLGPLLGDFFYNSNRSYLAWRDIPFVEPYGRAYTNAGQQFIQLGIFPLPLQQSPAPPDLFSQFGSRANLLYYDWEITPQRIWSNRLFFDLANILSKRYPQPPETPSKAWLMAVIAQFWKDPANPSQSVTEITQTGPNELQLIRKSHAGLTGFEMAALSVWLDSPVFPRYAPPGLVTGAHGTNAPGKKADRPQGVPKN